MNNVPTIDELELLLRKLFFDKDRRVDALLLQPLVPGKSGSSVLRVRPRYESELREPEVVKIDRRERADREVDNIREFVKGQMGDHKAPHLEREAHTTNLGAFSSSYLGLAFGDLKEFGAFYSQTDPAHCDAIVAAITDLFDDTCASWYANSRPASHTFGHWLNTEFYEIETRILEGIRLATTGAGLDPLIVFSDLPDQAFVHPLKSLRLAPLDQSYRESITHGDLNCRNILIDKHTQAWLIDYYRTRPSHVLRDFARLETSIVLEMVEVENFVRLFEFYKALTKVENLEDLAVPEKLVQEFPELGKASQAISLIRRLAHRIQLVGSARSDYCIMAGLNALTWAAYKEISAPRRRHAVAYGAMMLHSTVAKSTPS